ncbi:hypothetical protein [Arthrobacter sp. KK5.5]|uniref:hypothetical protein n=1 Tax=Arthrobacter sp. KK5.5 TaxID=3373084 RepID=UPI003EE4E8B0
MQNVIPIIAAASLQDTDPIVAATGLTGRELVIPEYGNMEIAGRTMDAYRFTLGEETSGAEKLWKSAVAPLVAAARGYQNITKDTASAMAASCGFKDLRAKDGYKIARSVAEHGSDAMFMPWFSLGNVMTAATLGAAPQRSTFQLRPSHPTLKDGKPIKYVNQAGVETCLGTHPCTPMPAITTAKLVLFGEGLLKVDSALSSYLAKYAAPGELENEHGGNTEAARLALTDLWARIPQDELVLFVELVGCWNWKGKVDWASLEMKGRTARIGMDADTAKNPAVWEAANGMLGHVTRANHAAEAFMLHLPADSAEGKDGLDDFMANGGSFDDLEALAGPLGERPGLQGKLARINVGTTDLQGGVTFGVERVLDKLTGAPSYQMVPWAEAAVMITKLTVLTSPFVGALSRTTMDGVASWLTEGPDGEERVEMATFEGKPLSLLTATYSNVPETFSTLTCGIIPVVDRNHAPDIFQAWSATQKQAERAEIIATTGLWIDRGDMVWLGTNGSITATGFRENIRGKAESLPEVDLVYVDPDENPGAVIRAFKEWNDARDLLTDDFVSFHTAQTGAVMASALGLQVQGGFALFLKRGSGKSELLKICGLWYGPAWGKRTAIKLNGTVAALTRSMLDGNNLVIGMDDARKKPNAQKQQELRDTVDAAMRIANEADALPRKSVQAPGGGWINAPELPFSVRVPLITGENIKVLGMEASTAQRTFSWTPADGGSLLKGHGRIKPALAKLTENRAQSILLSAVIVNALRMVQGTSNPRAELDAVMQHLRQREYEILGTYDVGLTERDRDIVAPILAGYRAMTRTLMQAVKAGGAVGLLSNPEASLKAWMKARRDEIVEAWLRHRERFGEDAEATHAPIIQVLAEALENGTACWGQPVAPNDVKARMPQCLGKVERGKVFLLKAGTQKILKDMARNHDAAELELEFSERGKTVKRRPYAGVTSALYGWEIDLSVWNEALGFGQTDDDTDLSGPERGMVENRVVPFGEIATVGMRQDTRTRKELIEAYAAA